MLRLDQHLWIFWLAQLPVVFTYARALHRRGPSLRTEAVALALAGFTFVGMAALLDRLGMNPFGIVHLIFAALVFTAPALLVVSGQRGALQGARTKGWIQSALVLPLVGVGAFAWWVEPFRLTTEEVTVPVPISRSLVVGVLADMQAESVGEKERRAIDRLMEAAPDLILIPGDVFQGTGAAWDEHRSQLVELLSRLRAPLGVYAVTGDTDRQRQFASLVQQAGIQWLADEQVVLDFEGERLLLVGVPVRHNWRRAGHGRVFERAFDTPATAKILLSHRPGVVNHLPSNHDFDLVVAGHTHGGQIAMPFLGPILTLSEVPRTVAAGGLHEIASTYLYVSRGVGVERGQAPRIRFGVRPEVSILKLVPAASGAPMPTR